MKDINRRECLHRLFVAGIAVATGLPKIATAAQTQESETSDPGVPAELLLFDTTVAEHPLTFRSRGPKKDSSALADRMVAIAKDYARSNIDRQKDHGREVEQFLKLFGLSLRYANGDFVPYCAAGLSFTACRAYAELDPSVTYDPNDPDPALSGVLTDINHYYFKPSPAVRFIERDAQTRGTWMHPSGAKPKRGWLVVFSWKKDGHPDHIGLVDELTSKGLATVEFNTSSGAGGSQSNGGAVAQRIRNLDYVLGYIQTH